MTSTPPPAGRLPTGFTGADALDRAIETTSPRGWIALLAIGIALVVTGVWAFIATVPEQVSSEGVISTFQYSYDISAPVDGIVSFDQRLNGQVAADQVLGTVTPFDGGDPVPVSATQAGGVKAVYVSVGQGVTAGQVLATIYLRPDPAEGIDVFAYIPESDALHYFVGQEVEVYVENVASSATTVTTGVVVDVATSPSTVDSIVTQSGSITLAQKWVDSSGGAPFRVIVSLDEWPADVAPPGPGELVSIVNTYANSHPIELLFGGR